jgi:hypothetical protein
MSVRPTRCWRSTAKWGRDSPFDETLAADVVARVSWLLNQEAAVSNTETREPPADIRRLRRCSWDDWDQLEGLARHKA